MIYTMFTGSAFTVMMRIEVDGVDAVEADVDTITYAVHSTGVETPITSGSLVVADVMFDTLQTGPMWDVDSEGYNMLHELDHTTLPDEGLFYVVYEVTCGATVFTDRTEQIRAKHPYNA